MILFISIYIVYLLTSYICWVYKIWGPDLVYREIYENLSSSKYTPGFRACFSPRWGTAWPSGSRPSTSCCRCTPRSSCGCIRCPWTCHQGGSPDPWQNLSTLYRTGQHTYSKSYLSLLNRFKVIKMKLFFCLKKTQLNFKNKTARVITLNSTEL